MSKETFAECLREVGHKVVKAGGSLWYDIYPRYYHTFMNFPDHIPIQPSVEDIDQLLGVTGLAARYTCPPSEGRLSYQYTCTDKEYSLEKVSPNVRSKIRRGLKRCSVRQLSFSDLMKRGALDLNDSTLLRQGRKISTYNRRYLTRFYQVADHTETAEAWGAFVNNQLAAYLIAFRIENCAKILHVRSDKTLLKYYPNNALLYTYAQHALVLPEITDVSFGLEPLQPDLGALDSFKVGMGYHKKSIGQQIILNRYLQQFFEIAFLEVSSEECRSRVLPKMYGNWRPC